MSWLLAKLLVVLFGLGLIALGLVAARLAVSGVGANFQAWRTRQNRGRWPSIPGTVVRSRVETAVASSHPPIVEYYYEVGGALYRGSQSDFDADTMRDAEDVIARYEKGTPVPVFYDPADPSRSVIERNTGGGCFALCLPLLPALFAVALIAGGVGILTQHGLFRK